VECFAEEVIPHSSDKVSKKAACERRSDEMEAGNAVTREELLAHLEKRGIQRK
jgi:hypothetical protein